MIKTIFIFTFLVLNVHTQYEYLPQYFDVQLDRFEVLYQNPEMVNINLKIQKVKKVRSLIGDLKFLVPLTDTVMCNLKFLKKQGNEYKYMPYRWTPIAACDIPAKVGPGYEEVARGSDLPENFTCPFPAGTYKFYNVTVGLKRIPKIILPTGDYAFEGICDDQGTEVLKERVYATIVQV